MAVVESVGYGGTVDYPDYGRGVVSGSRYTLDRGNPLRPTRVTSGADRTVRLSAGTVQGYGVRDTCTQTDVQLEPVSSGVRWDLIVVRRDWSAEESSIVAIQGGSSRALPSRNEDPGIIDDQPIALVQITAGQQYPTDLVDLRCWNGDGGLAAVDTLALSYLDVAGTRVSIGDTTYTRVVAPNGSMSWDANNSVRALQVQVSPVNSSLWSRNLVYARDGNMVTVWARPWRMPGTNPPGEASRLYNLPAEARPLVDWWTDAICPLRSESEFSRFPVKITTDGRVIMSHTGDPGGERIWANTTYYFSVTYTAGN